MNFSKKNHEHKGVNLKSVSKKIILGVVFLLATVTTINAAILVKSCAEIAFELQTDLEDNGVDMGTANEVASLIYDICEANSDSNP